MKNNLNELQKKIGVKFKKPDLLKEALTHRSYLNENPKWPFSQNERMEFLGDAVLELITTDFLYRKFLDYQEGQLTSLRAALVNYQMLAEVGREISLENFIFLSKGETKDTGRAREVILANGIEALLGAIYLDQGYKASEKFINKFILKHLKEVIEKKLYRDPKSLLQEIVQEKLKITPTYRVLEETGPDHQKKFLVGAFFSEKLITKGIGMSKQEAEIKAAEAALQKIKNK